jgi:hypothetical protein
MQAIQTVKSLLKKIFGERRVALPAHPAGHTRLYGHPVPDLNKQTDA